jgi:hypothetical protein
MTAAAFEATFSDFKIIRGRKVAQVVLEVPLEAADTALRVLGGVPRPDAECWVAVARLQRSGAQAHEPGNAPPAGGTEGRSRPERVPDMGWRAEAATGAVRDGLRQLATGQMRGVLPRHLRHGQGRKGEI